MVEVIEQELSEDAGARTEIIDSGIARKICLGEDAIENFGWIAGPPGRIGFSFA